MDALCLIFILLLLLCFYYIFVCFSSKYPPGPKSLPFVGNSAMVKRLSKKYNGLHFALLKLCKDYNTNILTLQLGRDRVVVVQSEELIKEVLTREEFQGRPDNFFIRLRSMGTRKGITMTDGPLWTEQRAFAMKYMHEFGFGSRRMDYLIQEELQDLLAILEDTDSSVKLRQQLSKCILNILWAMMTGSRFGREDTTLNKLISFMEQRAKAFDMGGGYLSQFPWLRFIAPRASGYTLIKQLNDKFKIMISEIIEEHKNTYDKEQTRDYIDAFLHEMYKSTSKESTFEDAQLVMVCLDFFIAGSQTTSSTLDFALLYMILNPEVQKKIQYHLDQVLQPGQLPSTMDRPKLAYVEAVLLECQRISHVVPVIGPRRVLSHTHLGGYYIPKETTILLNLVSINKEESKWKNPETFIPERFLDEDGKLRDDRKLYTFGKGKRRCPGESLAKSFLFIFFSGLLHRYSLLPVNPAEPPKLASIPGITLSPVPYSIKLVNRFIAASQD